MADNIRLIHKPSVETEELKGYRPALGETIVTYAPVSEDENTPPRTCMKLGDGQTPVSELPSICTCLYGTSVPDTIPAGVVYFVYED